MKHIHFIVATLFACMFVIVSPSARAYEPLIGNRAANFSGFDIVNREVVELEDYLGQWVYVEYWATW